MTRPAAALAVLALALALAAAAGTTSPPSSGVSTRAGSVTSVTTAGSTKPGATVAAGSVTTEAASTTKASKDASCFPAGATVELEGGAPVRMDALRVGDRVHVGGGAFSDVFMFTHKVADFAGDFVEIATAGGAVVRATAGHFMYVNGGLAAAGTVAAGDSVELGRGGADVVARVSTVASTGLYNPQTVQGDVVVDGVRASTYTTAVEPAVAHAALAPARAVYAAFGWSTSVLDEGSSWAAALPSGGAVVA
jgi:hypothetical protein